MAQDRFQHLYGFPSQHGFGPKEYQRVSAAIQHRKCRCPGIKCLHLKLVPPDCDNQRQYHWQETQDKITRNNKETRFRLLNFLEETFLSC